MILLTNACRRSRATDSNQVAPTVEVTAVVAPSSVLSERECGYGKSAEGCDLNTVCAHVERDQPARCVPFATEDESLAPPFVSGLSFWVGQRGRSPKGRSHSWRNDLYAVDFVPSSRVPQVAVAAPSAGQAYIFDGCEERDSGPDSNNDTSCGLGYGNHVRIWDGRNLVLLAHLARITIANGPVTRGQVLGLAGSSGRAGYRHVHVTVTRPASDSAVQEILANSGWMGSIPVRVRYVLASDLATKQFWSDELPVSLEHEGGQRWLVP
jgi:hypothetical protein